MDTDAQAFEQTKAERNLDAAEIARLPETCTGALMSDATIQHDAETCPVHESLRLAWCGDTRRDVTFSMADFRALELARAAALGALGDAGATLVGPSLGVWRGNTEYAYTLTLIGRNTTWRDVVRALHAAGCEAVQVETWAADAYYVEEWRAA